MKISHRAIPAALGALLLLALSAAAQNAPTTLPATQPAQGSADTAAPKLDRNGKIEARFLRLHQEFLRRGAQGKIGLLFVGDSITELWDTRGRDVWSRFYFNLYPANFGISGDQTQNVLWRIENGELDGINPKVVVLMIGTNNIGDSADNILRAEQKIVWEIHQKLPDAKLLLLGIFPRGADASDPTVALMRQKIKTVNQGLAKLDDGNKTRYLDIGDKFLDPNGNLPPQIMPDALHPSAKGYAIWASTMQPLLEQMMK